MIGYDYRFHRRNHLRFVYEHGQGVRGKDISLKYVTEREHDKFRVAVVVSKKVTKKAITRNTIRRKIFEIIRSHKNNISNDCDFIISVFDSSVAEQPAEELETKILELLNSADIYKQ